MGGFWGSGFRVLRIVSARACGLYTDSPEVTLLRGPNESVFAFRMVRLMIQILCITLRTRNYGNYGVDSLFLGDFYNLYIINRSYAG